MEDADFQRTRRAIRLFERLVDLPFRERAAALDSTAGSDPELRRRVERLLRADVEAAGFLQTAAADRLPDLIEALPPPPRIGAYRLVEEIGRGGMGIVYRAERVENGFREQVCLKLLKRGMDSEEFLQRFLRERQILAWLRHPNIASLLDVGVAEDGRPYFVMEYIDGRPITEYCAGRDLPVSARLLLFRQVCRGVQLAHNKLVVHRDLKPSNILVTGRGEVKILDFGVAKLLGGDEDTLTTKTAVLLTPQYAAPEQVTGGPISTATDVYALGLLLYEILSGRRPYRVDAALPADMKRAIVDSDPPKPSALASTRQRARALAGDLDNIVLTALRRVPEDRYPTAAALDEDIGRHLADRPVRARPPSLDYRARKFVRRHRWGVAASAVVLLSLLAGMVGVIWQSRQTVRQAEKAEAVTAFMTGLFDVASPSVTKGSGITARMMLDSAAGRIDGELGGQPEVQAEVMSIIGGFYDRIGVYEDAESLLTRSVAIQRRLGLARGRLYAETLARLATAHQARGDLEPAETLFREALQVTKSAGAEREAISRMNDLAVLLRQRGEGAEAESLHRRVLALRRRETPEDQSGIAYTMNNLGVLLMDRGELDEAEGYCRQALRIRLGLFGDTSVEVANTLQNLMVVSRRRGNLDSAEARARRVLALRRRLLGPDHPDVTSTLFNLGAILHSRGDRAGAEPIYREAISRLAKALGADHPEVAAMRVSLARLLREQGDVLEAEKMVRRSLATIREGMPPRHPWEAGALLELGRNLREQKRIGEARDCLTKALEIRQDRYGPESSPVAEVRKELDLCAVGN